MITMQQEFLCHFSKLDIPISTLSSNSVDASRVSLKSVDGMFAEGAKVLSSLVYFFGGQSKFTEFHFQESF